MAKAKNNLLETNVIYCADNLDVMRNLPSESIDLIYIDPPFFSNRTYETIWGDSNDTASFNDRWKGGIHHFSEWLRPRLEQMHRLLKPTGSFYCHMDWHAVHYIKIILDEIFGYNNFRNEIIWDYGAKATPQKKMFPKKHDNILFYTKSGKYKFKPIIVEYADATLRERDTRYKLKDEKGRYRMTTRRDTKGKKYRAKVYLNSGVPETDVWQLPIINATSKERVGYPTQKPLNLLERIIESSSKKGDVVADFFCGCGTTLVASHNLGRKYIGVDNSPTASKIIRKRLKGLGVDIPELAVKTLTKAQILKLNHFDFEEYAVRCIGGEPNRKKVGDGGIDGLLIEDGTPIQVKMSKNVGRPVLDSFHKHLKKNNRGVIIALSFGKGAYEEAAKLKREGYDVDLVTLDNILEMTPYQQAQKLEITKPKRKTKKKRSRKAR
ncbi:MAG: hypothetical protein DRQ88_12045 [Epsilonproteobacteria bacterium]|nr:MAG: hypothetical protein DRQ88_12045 [Campylobacterota bacterium]